MAFDINNIPPEVRQQATDALTEFVEEKLGLTIERQAAFYKESKEEAATDGETDFRADAIGKAKHYLRVEKHLEGLVDAFWPLAEPFVAKLTDAAIAGGA